MQEVEFSVDLVRTNKRQIAVKVVLENKFTVEGKINSYTDITEQQLEQEVRIASRRAMDLKMGGVKIIFKEFIKETKNKWIVRTKIL